MTRRRPGYRRRGSDGATLRGLLAASLIALPVIAGIVYATAGALELAGVGALARVPAPDRLRHILVERSTWLSLAFTLWYSAAATAIASVAAMTVAAVFRGARHGGRQGGRLARWLAIAPLPVPYVVAGALGLLLLSQSGWLSRVMHAAGWITAPADMPAIVYDRWGVALILTVAWKEFPFLTLISVSLLATRGPDLEEAARTLGAGALQTYLRVTVPFLWRGLLPAVTAVFIFVAGNYEVPALLAASNPMPLPVLTLERYHALSLDQRADGYALSLLALMLSIVAVALHEWARARSERFRQ